MYTNNYYYEHSSPSPCNCRNVKHCPPILDVLISSEKPISTELIKRLRRITCGYDRNVVMVCCPTADTRYRRDDFRRQQEENNDKPWVWDTEIDRHQNEFSINDPNNLYHRFEHDFNDNARKSPISHNWEYYNFHPNNLNFNLDGKRKSPKSKKHYFFEFEDPLTFKNCPKSFSKEFDLPHHFRHIKPIRNTHPMKLPTNVVHTTLQTTEPTVQTTTQNSDIEITMTAETSTVTAMSTVTDTTTVSPNNDSIDKNILINTELCGLSVNTRIIGGADADPGQFPWMARLAYRNRSKFSLLNLKK